MTKAEIKELALAELLLDVKTTTADEIAVEGLTDAEALYFYKQYDKAKDSLIKKLEKRVYDN